MAKTYLGTSVLDIMPESIRNDPQVRAAAKALDVELNKCAADIRENLLISRIDELPEIVLDLLAWQWHVDFYEPIGLDIETKRALIKKSIAWHRIKGTIGAVEEVLAAAFGKTSVQPWYDYGGDSYFFRLLLDEYPERENIENVLKATKSTKNVRSWLDSINYEITREANLYMGGFLNAEVDRIDIAPLPDTGIMPMFAGAIGEDEIRRIYPSIMLRKDVPFSIGLLMQSLLYQRIGPANFVPLDVEFGEYLFPLVAGGFLGDNVIRRIRARSPTAYSIGVSPVFVTEAGLEGLAPASLTGIAGKQYIGALLSWMQFARINADLSDVERMAELGYQDFPVEYQEYLGTLAEDEVSRIGPQYRWQISGGLSSGAFMEAPLPIRFGFDIADLAKVKELDIFDEDMATQIHEGGIITDDSDGIGAQMYPYRLTPEQYYGVITDTDDDHIGTAQPVFADTVNIGALLGWLHIDTISCDMSDIDKMAESGYEEFHAEQYTGMLAEDEISRIESAAPIGDLLGSIFAGSILGDNSSRIGCDLSDVDRMAESDIEDINLEQYTGILAEDEIIGIRSASPRDVISSIFAGAVLRNDYYSRIGCDMSDVGRLDGDIPETFILAHQLPYILG